jgi:hypothetical protein
VCQCGCGEFPVENAYTLPSGEIVGYGIYRGCEDCYAGPGVSVYVYPNEESEWLRDAKIESYEPDEFGGNKGYGISVSFFEVCDLIKAATEIGGDFEKTHGYETVAEWLEDNGLRMMQDAMRLFEKRCAELAKDRKVGG